jgi:hypothetical protein
MVVVQTMTSQQHYCLLRVEEVDYQEPLPRKNGWRYTGPDGRPYRQQVAFETGFRVHLPWKPPFTTAAGQQWFNAIEPGGDAALQPFVPWALLALQEGRVHPDDEAAWRFAFVDVEGGGKGKYHISQADSTWRTFITWVQQRAHTAVEAENSAERPAPVRELSIASFGNLPVRYEPATAFGKEWKALLPAGAFCCSTGQAVGSGLASETWMKTLAPCCRFLHQVEVHHRRVPVMR